MADAIRCDSVSRSFDNGVAVDNLTLSIPQGSVVALLGHNGAGKTTTVRLLNGVLTADSGTLSVLGLDPVANGTELRSRTGVVTENAGLDDRLTARENLEITASIRGMARKPARRRVNELLERFDMSAHADQQCQGFSTGQRRRVALARALVHDPELLFLDEPTSGLDPAGTRAVMDLIETSAAERGRTIVLCTHFLAEASTSADLMAVMHRGKLISFGNPVELAAQRWPGLEVHLDLGAMIDTATSEQLLRLDAVSAIEPQPNGAIATLADREDIPAVVASLVASGRPVYGTNALHKGLEDVYFAVQEEIFAHAAHDLDETDAASQLDSRAEVS